MYECRNSHQMVSLKWLLTKNEILADAPKFQAQCYIVGMS